MTSEIKNIADQLIDRLKYENFILHRYTGRNSIYLKLDWGVCNSIRIANHPGKQKLSYRYTIGPHIPEYKENSRNGYPTFEYATTDFEKLIDDILTRRKNLLDRYGEIGYQTIMGRRQGDTKGVKKGFWRDCIRIN